MLNSTLDTALYETGRETELQARHVKTLAYLDKAFYGETIRNICTSLLLFLFALQNNSESATDQHLGFKDPRM